MLNTESISAREPALVSLRRAQKGDLFALAAMVEALAAHHGDKPSNNATKLDRDLFGETPFVTAFVAETGGELIGYALLYPTYRATEGERGMELHHLYVKPDHRGEGIGRHLVNKAKAHAATLGCDYLSLGAATGNFAAYKFYQGLDFRAYPSTGMRFRATI
jgi:GNAT superfamily N-acetyltransferase